MHPLLSGKKLIAFDLDGTLIDSVPDLAAALARALEAEDLAVPEQENVSRWVGNGTYRLVERGLAWAQSTPENRLDRARLNRLYAAFMRYYGKAPHRLTRLYPGAAETLYALREAGFVLVLITNKPERFIAPLLEHFALSEAFALCLGGDSLARKKPDPLPLTHAAARFSVAPSACVMVGDSCHDIAAGKAAGFATAALTYGYNHGEPIGQSRPDALLDSLSELL
ncbi:phosphoglycolate phosphatase [Halomonas cibimaris]|uniref:Phosphoglycolate phosphatase n=1 Tax=Halomonas cibimaris TaxID=657012 RepID=A0ABP7LI65_9GAMM